MQLDSSYNNSKVIVGHQMDPKAVLATWVSLLVMALVMVGLSRIDTSALAGHWIQDMVDFQALKVFVVLSIATVMGALIALVLMGLRYDSNLFNAAVFGGNFIFLLLFVIFTWADVAYRGQIEPGFTEKIDYSSPVKVKPQAAAPQVLPPTSAPLPAASGSTAPAASPAAAGSSAPAAPAAGSTAPAGDAAAPTAHGR